MLVKIPQSDWCQCQTWRLVQQVLVNHDKMGFCPFCGAKLVRRKEQGADDEREQYVIPRQGYFYVGRQASPERLTVFHILKDGEYNFLCGMQKPVGAQPPPDIPQISRCCSECLRKLRKIPSIPGPDQVEP